MKAFRVTVVGAEFRLDQLTHQAPQFEGRHLSDHFFHHASYRACLDLEGIPGQELVRPESTL